ncbi:MAG TPA: hypothetical protein VGG05_18075 [Pseudonocardiaceae bacterium]
MHPAALLARCESRLANLDVPHPFDLTTFCARLSERRARLIVLLPTEIAADSHSGMWIKGERQDYIVFERTTTPLHQTHIALHEIGHLLCEHTSPLPPADAHLDRLFPTLDPELVRSALSRAGYSTGDETEAELLASLILRRAHLNPGPPPATPTERILRRLESGL